MAEQKKKIRVTVLPANTTVLGARVLDLLMKKPEAVEAFGFLKNPPVIVVKSCCGKSTKQTDYESLKCAVAELDAVQMERFKQMIPAVKLRIVYKQDTKIRTMLA